MVGVAGASVGAGFLSSPKQWVVGNRRRQRALKPSIFSLEVSEPDPILRSSRTRPGRGVGTGQFGPGDAGRAWVGDGVGGTVATGSGTFKRLREGARSRTNPGSNSIPASRASLPSSGKWE